MKEYLENEVVSISSLIKIRTKQNDYYYYTDNSFSINYQDNNYIAGQVISASSAELNANLDEDNFELQLGFDGNLTAQKIQDGILDMAEIEIRLIDPENPKNFEQVLICGYVVATEIKDFSYNLIIKGRVDLLSSFVLPSFGGKCRAEFCGPECGLSQESLEGNSVCDKSYQTCVSKYNNAVNFRGFPFIPSLKSLIAREVK